MPFLAMGSQLIELRLPPIEHTLALLGRPRKQREEKKKEKKKKKKKKNTRPTALLACSPHKPVLFHPALWQAHSWANVGVRSPLHVLAGMRPPVLAGPHFR